MRKLILLKIAPKEGIYARPEALINNIFSVYDRC